MKGHYCDRCGRPFKDTSVEDRKDEVLGVMFYSLNGYDYKHTKHDLCDLCLAKLYAWLKDEDTEVSNEGIH